MKLIVVILSREGGYDRDVLRGIGASLSLYPDWRVHIAESPRTALEVLRRWRPAGVIGRLGLEGVAETIQRRRITAVNVSNSSAAPNLPRVGIDEHAVGREAARYFRSRGFTRFGFFSLGRNNPFVIERRAGFEEALRSEGFSSWEVHGAPTASGPPARLLRWLGTLVRPTAVLASNDYGAAVFCQICRQAGLRVPEDIAVLGVDNDDLLCEISHPQLSSVIVPARRIGHQAMLLLDRLLKGSKPPRSPVLLPPEGIVTRRSTDVQAIEHAELAQAVRFIRERAHEPVYVADVLAEVAISRRALEQAFRRSLGRTPQQEIDLAHVDRARELLARTELSLPAIAEACGLNDRHRLSVLFKRLTGHTPAAYRRQFRSY